MRKEEVPHGISGLDVFGQFNVIPDIRDRIRDAQASEVISEEERKLLLARLANYRSNPDSATDWADLKQAVHVQW
uniref:Addiction module component, TIGR02574 family n=1 Tax=Candidatus Kentrum sp. DK TaxID=2126562 RepID=A0A450RUD1_9GAMM|nr:MAG: hypothetical protein BECKDK2373C_GA0170839_100237 [Candidatus Kentron sp. DK]